jgi:predicted nucleotidyltransferase
VFQALLQKIAAILDANGISYIIIGGHAVFVYGEFRATKDIDFSLALTPDDLPRFLPIVEKAGLQPMVPDGPLFARKNWFLPCSDSDTGLRVDFIFTITPFERDAISRANRVQVDGQFIRYVAVDDLVIQKIVAGRPRDLDDVRTIFLKTPNLNLPFIESVLRQFEEALSESLVETFRSVLNN